MKRKYQLIYTAPDREPTTRLFDTKLQAQFAMKNEYFDTLEDDTHMAYGRNNEFHFIFNSDSAQLKYSDSYIFTWQIREL